MYKSFYVHFPSPINHNKNTKNFLFLLLLTVQIRKQLYYKDHVFSIVRAKLVFYHAHQVNFLQTVVDPGELGYCCCSSCQFS